MSASFAGLCETSLREALRTLKCSVNILAVVIRLGAGTSALSKMPLSQIEGQGREEWVIVVTTVVKIKQFLRSRAGVLAQKLI